MISFSPTSSTVPLPTLAFATALDMSLSSSLSQKNSEATANRLVEFLPSEYQNDFVTGNMARPVGVLMQLAQETQDLSGHAKHLFVEKHFNEGLTKIFSVSEDRSLDTLSTELCLMQNAISDLIITTKAIYKNNTDCIEFLNLPKDMSVRKSIIYKQKFVTQNSLIIYNLCKDSLREDRIVPLAGLVFLVTKEISNLSKDQIQDLRQQLINEIINATFSDDSPDIYPYEKIRIIKKLIPPLFQLFSEAHEKKIDLATRKIPAKPTTWCCKKCVLL